MKVRLQLELMILAMEDVQQAFRAYSESVSTDDLIAFADAFNKANYYLGKLEQP